MKNKLFYGLFLAYAAMVAFVLYANGVFKGNVPSPSNLAINGIFLGIIGVLFVISTVSFIRLNGVTDDLRAVSTKLLEKYKKNGNKNLWAEIRDDKNLFQDENLKKAFGKYCLRMKNSQSGRGYINACDIEEYINEELIEKVGSNYFNSGISGTLTGLGILGTFVGLSLGLGAFNGDDIYTISDNVGPLLSGMKVAFHTSVYGILLSLIFNFAYRSIMADAYGKLDQFLNIYKQCALPPSVGSEEDNIAAMLIHHANEANYLKQLVALAKGEAEEQSGAMEHMAEHFLSQLQRIMGTEFKALGNALNGSAEAAAVSEEGIRRMIDAANALVESSQGMQEGMAKMMERQEAFSRELEEQKKTLEETCEEIGRDISNQLYTFEQMRDLYEK